MASGESESESDEEPINYKNWLAKRRVLRDGLNKMDLDLEYLKRKQNLTETEKRVLFKMMYFDKEIQTDPIVKN